MGQTMDIGQAMASGAQAGIAEDRRPAQTERDTQAAGKDKASSAYIRQQQNLAEAQERLTNATWQETSAKATLLENQIPQSDLVRKHYESDYGRKTTGPIQGAKDLLGPAGSAAQLFRDIGIGRGAGRSR